MSVGGELAEDRQNRHYEMLAVTLLEPEEILRDRSVAAFRLLRWAALGAPLLFLIIFPQRPSLVPLGAALLLAMGYSQARAVGGFALWCGLRFNKPSRGIAVGAAALLALNVGVPTLAAMAMSRNVSTERLMFGICLATPFGGAVMAMISGYEDHFWRNISVLAMALWAALLFGFWTLAGHRFRKASVKLLERRMHDDPQPGGG